MNSVADITEAAQYLTFSLGDEKFAIDVSRVNGISEVMKITRVPKAAEFMIGVVNLRGSALPVADLRLRLGMEPVERTIDTCIVVLEIAMDGDEEETVLLGILVDSVEEVVDMEPGDIEPPPRMGTRLRAEFIKGMGRREDEFVIILDIDRIFTTEELVLVQEIDGDTPAEEDTANSEVVKAKK
ncbi:MAG: chemotaxis protein CheW [Spirochaetaceae bacterium]|nr:chemotaxis protein CheW [Spirochaetaceae bacterium]